MIQYWYKCINTITQYKNDSFDNVAKENIKEYTTNWPQIPNHPYRILITGASGFEKANSLFSLLGCQPCINQIHLDGKDPHVAKYQFWLANVKIQDYSILIILKRLLNVKSIYMQIIHSIWCKIPMFNLQTGRFRFKNSIEYSDDMNDMKILKNTIQLRNKK